MKVLGLALVAALVSSAALADEVTTIKRTEGPLGDSTVVTKERSDDVAVTTRRSVETTGAIGCETKSVTKTNDRGDTKTKTRTDC